MNGLHLDFALSGFKVSQKPLFPFCSCVCARVCVYIAYRSLACAAQDDRRVVARLPAGHLVASVSEAVSIDDTYSCL